MALRINMPPLTRVLLVLLVALSVIYQLAYFRGRKAADYSKPIVIPWLTLTPQLSIFYPWVYVTSTLTERNVVTLMVAGATLLYGGKYLERAWGAAEFGKYLLVVTLIPNVVASIIYVLTFAVLRVDSSALVVLQGSISLQAAFLVAFKQLVPEHTVTILRGIVKVRVKHFPAIFLAATTISGIVLFTDTVAILSWLGFLTSWIYLRFYKRQPDLSGTSTGGATIRGDASETFAFAYFWPDIVHGPVATFSDGIYNVLVGLKICTPFSEEEIESSNEQANARGEGGLPSLMNQGGRRGGDGGKREEAERRRALALKALDQRLQAATANRQQSAPSASTADNATITSSTPETTSERQNNPSNV